MTGRLDAQVEGEQCDGHRENAVAEGLGPSLVHADILPEPADVGVRSGPAD
jgi:hypothetical protein